MNKWSKAKHEASIAAANAKVASLEQELSATRATLKRTLDARRVKLPSVKRPRARRSGDIIRVCIPDTHGSKICPDAFNAVLADIQALKPHEIILLGDHVDCGGFLAAHHVMGYVAESTYSYESDLEHANAMLDALQIAAPEAKIEYIEGNHERRVETWCVTQTMRHQRDAEGLRICYAPEYRLHLGERGIPYYRQGEFYDGLSTPGVIRRGKCYFFHGISTARAAVARTVESIAGNCVFAHTHRAQTEVLRRVGTGVIGGWNPGCLCELQPLWQHTAPTTWTHGYGVQLVADSGDFLHLNIPVLNGKSYLSSLFSL